MISSFGDTILIMGIGLDGFSTEARTVVNLIIAQPSLTVEH